MRNKTNEAQRVRPKMPLDGGRSISPPTSASGHSVNSSSRTRVSQCGRFGINERSGLSVRVDVRPPTAWASPTNAMPQQYQDV